MAKNRAIIPQRAEDASERIDSLNEALARHILIIGTKSDQIQELEFNLQQKVQEIEDKNTEIDSLKSKLHIEERTVSERGQIIAELRLKVETLANSLRAIIGTIEGK